MSSALRALWVAITRERAVLAGVAIAVLQALQAGELTKETAVPVLAGIVLRFFVSPYHRPAGGQGPAGEEGDLDDPHVPADLLELYEVLEFTGKIPPPLPPPGEEGSGT